tara:strand:- start:4774 stop:6561 length:1788 start_codon:yes stop_codon:yes gene_type:complete
MSGLKNIFKVNTNILIIFLFLYIILLNLFQLSQQHWSSMLDQDIKIIYNSLLISSGIEQEYRDHPAYSTFLLLGSFFKFLSLFSDSYTIYEIFKSEAIDESFQTLFIIARILNSFYVFLVAFILFVILKELNIKNNLSISIIFLLLIFQDTYELLFLIRSEILSVFLILLFYYFLIKFIKEKKIKYSIFSGFFFCLAMLAKIQVIFLFFTFLISLPFLFSYLNISKINLSYTKNFYLLSLVFLLLFLIFYIFFQIALGIAFIKEFDDQRFYFTNNIDLIFLLAFIIFYYLFVKILSKKNIINASEIMIVISSILVGYVVCIVFILFLDLINLVPFNKLNFMRLTNPLEYMTSFTKKYQTDTNILNSMKHFILGFGGFLEINFNKQKEISSILYMDPRTFFRTLQVLFFIFLIYFSLKKKNTTKINFLSMSLFVGIFILYLSFNLRETHGYNIYLFPLYVIILAIIFNELKNKLIIIFYFCISIIFISENFVLSNIYTNIFNREPRVYDICAYEKIEIIKWKNSENYIENYNKSSFIELVPIPMEWLARYTQRLVPSERIGNKIKIITEENKFLKKYCNQIKNEKTQRSIFYKLKP